jgi:hypothetical protein
MNFDTPTSRLRVSVDVIATVVFGSLGHSTTDSFPLKSNVPADDQFWEGGNKHRSDWRDIVVDFDARSTIR